MIAKTVENYMEPRLGQWQPNQGANLPQLTKPNGNVIELDGNNMVLLNNATTVSYTVIPNLSRTPAVQQDAAEATIFNNGSAAQTINLRRKNGTIATSFSMTNNQVVELKYLGKVDRYKYTNTATY
jgi:hypothetical protein